jgi:hypothetical protein
MNLVQHCIARSLLLCCIFSAPALVQGQDSREASRLYSQGVHAYFAGRSTDAESYLSSALALETQDPRMYYFRALSLMRLGRVDEARGDIMIGASLEATQPNRFPIGAALERVQGSNRLLLEKYRRQGRADAATNRQQLRRERYPQSFRERQTFDDEAQVLRQRIVIPLDQFMRPGGPQPLSAEELAASSPTSPRSGDGVPTSAAAPSATSSSSRDNPFRDDPHEQPATPDTSQPPPAADSSDESTEALSEEEAAAEAPPTPQDEDDPFSEL